MRDIYIGQWFRCQMGLGKIISKFDLWHHPEYLKGTYKCVIFGKITHITWFHRKEVKLFKFLNCPEYYNIMILYGNSN